MSATISMYKSIISNLEPNEFKRKYSLTDVEFNDALKYEPFREIHSLEEDVIKGFLKVEKDTFVAENDFWDVMIYKEYHSVGFGMIEVELKDYLKKIENKKYRPWEPTSKSGFKSLTSEESYILFKNDRLDTPGSYEYLVVTKMKIPKLKWYISRILSLINEFYTNNDMSLDISTQERTELDKPKINISAKHYVLAYLFDCKVNNIVIPNGNKIELETIGKERSGGKLNGNTFYKNFNKIYNQNLTSKNILVQIGGNQWREAILELSQSPEELKRHLDKIGL